MLGAAVGGRRAVLAAVDIDYDGSLLIPPLELDWLICNHFIPSGSPALRQERKKHFVRDMVKLDQIKSFHIQA